MSYESDNPRSGHDDGLDEENRRPTLIQPRRNPGTLFRGWGPKLFALALVASSTTLPRSHASAADRNPASACPPARPAAMTDHPDVAYPAIPQLMGLTGKTIVEVDLSSAGDVEAAAIAKYSGNEAMDREALRVAHTSHFQAATVNCQPAAGVYYVEVDFGE
jgi:TonB family protein